LKYERRKMRMCFGVLCEREELYMSRAIKES
jgi:hypothetical protein